MKPLDLTANALAKKQSKSFHHNSALRFRSDSQRHTLGRGRSVTVCGGYNRAGDPGGWSLPLCAAVVIQREQTPAGVDDFLESLLTDGHS